MAQAKVATAQRSRVPPLTQRLADVLNGSGHKLALQILLVVTAAHWAEHAFQAIELFVLGWPRSVALGALGLVWPALVTSEWLHYLFALAMLIGLVILRPAFHGEARTWWDVALVIQVWHHVEHALLLGQALTGHYLFGGMVPTSVLQVFFPRIELHLFYNAVVTLPMLTAVFEHGRPSAARRQATCTCAARP